MIVPRHSLKRSRPAWLVRLARPARARPAVARRALAGPAFARPALALMLGLGAALLVSCGGSAANLIPAQDAGPLEHDIQAVADAAGAGNGHCEGTERAIEQTESEYRRLPSNVDEGLLSRLSEGIENLREHALHECRSAAHAATRTTETTVQTTATPPPTGPANTTTTSEAGGTTPAETTPVPSAEEEREEREEREREEPETTEPPVTTPVEKSGGLVVPPEMKPQAQQARKRKLQAPAGGRARARAGARAGGAGHR